MTIKDKNRIPELKRSIKKLANAEIKAGIIGDEQLAMIATVNEFGVDITVTDKMRGWLGAHGLHLKKDTEVIRIPERAAFRKALDSKKEQDELFSFAEEAIEKLDGLDKVLDATGQKAAGMIQESIKSNIPPVNHPFTIEQKKGKNKTLVNTGRLGQSITYEIKK